MQNTTFTMLANLCSVVTFTHPNDFLGVTGIKISFSSA
jgi:hypothetical protein